MKMYFEFSKNLKAVGMVAMGTQNLGLSLVSIKVKKKEKKIQNTKKPCYPYVSPEDNYLHLSSSFSFAGHNSSRVASGFSIEWNTYKPASQC